MNFFDNQQPRQMISVLVDKEQQIERHGNKFLVLGLENKRKIFVFPSNVPENEGNELLINQNYAFTVKESKPLPGYEIGVLQLVDFEEAEIEL